MITQRKHEAKGDIEPGPAAMDWQQWHEGMVFKATREEADRLIAKDRRDEWRRLLTTILASFATFSVAKLIWWLVFG